MDGLAEASLGELKAIFELNKKDRRIKSRKTRVDWEVHVMDLQHSREFESTYHMTLTSFNMLVDILRNDITVDEAKSRASSSGNDPIYPELVAGAGLRFLGGEFPKGLRDLYGISTSSVKRIIELFLTAVVNCDELALRVPITQDDLEKGARDFTNISGAHGIYHGAIGAIDGWLCCTNMPMDVINSADYFSGHYNRYGFNVQAICDANLRFIYMSIAAPGKTNDNRAFGRLSELRKWLDGLPDEYFIIGDGAYTLSNRILIPFSGAQKHTTHNRTFNFYLSQMRIRIEMAFGRLSTKWRIFRTNLSGTSHVNSMIIQAAARLHNFVIDKESLSFDSLRDDNNLAAWGVDCLLPGPYIPYPNRGFLPNRPPRPVAIPPNIGRRAAIVDQLIEVDMRRPHHNKIRNEELDYATDHTLD